MSTILVTGATGFLGSRVVSQLLEQNHTVRVVARHGDTARIRKIFPDASPDSLQVAEVDSLTSDLSASMQDVVAVIHVASPAYFKGEKAKDILQGAYSGTLNIIETAIKNGVKKIVTTGSIVSLFDADLKVAFGTKPLNEHDFAAVTLDTIVLDDNNIALMYRQSKAITEKMIWDIAHKNPDVDFTVILPPVILGPYLPNYPLPVDPVHFGPIGSVIHQLITDPERKYPASPFSYFVDVRDVAKAHILALAAPPLAEGKDKRIIVLGKMFTWRETVDLIRERRPELADRLPPASVVPPGQTTAPLDLTLAKEILGLESYIPWEETMIATIDLRLRWEMEHQ
ncbi:hypothetical protein C8J56DRAFT_1020296 [Mycena floridula]|nr:hypothetical protein C8J56DRAFT_1020296 [Mycena floridula]